ncbi:hypothetical protein M3I54_44455, partial [Paraburkholderia sp. CNPSo 3274]|uniref:hypothetical protein n=1 Tax=Paraburkholderia sp. CNPSo 3274 TaxID=2940932 RepID=UPI0020B8FCA3
PHPALKSRPYRPPRWGVAQNGPLAMIPLSGRPARGTAAMSVTCEIYNQLQGGAGERQIKDPALAYWACIINKGSSGFRFMEE